MDVERRVGGLRFTRADLLHAAGGAVPGFVVVCLGHLPVGLALLIGLLPTSLMGIAPTRRLRLVYGLLGCLFGVGVAVGSWIVVAHNVAVTSLLLFACATAAAILSARRPAGPLLLALVIPSIGVGTGYLPSAALRLTVAFALGSLWSAAVSMLWPETSPDPAAAARLAAQKPRRPLEYGILLGLTAASAYLVGSLLDPDHAGWVATAALLVMRPLHEMTGVRGVGRALSTVAGTALVVLYLSFEFGAVPTAIVGSAVAIVTIGARSSTWYVTSFGTAFLILAIELSDQPVIAEVRRVAGLRILDNVVGAALALFFGLVVPGALERLGRGQALAPSAGP